jgi:iron uptake system component EfeO
VQLANGSKELVDEVATGKITGEEDRNSHTDLWDFQANVEGSKAAIASLRPVLAERDPALVSLIGRRFEEVETELAKHAKATASSSTPS